MRKKKEKETENSERSPEQIKDLEDALKDAELKAAACSKMIELAEKQYNETQEFLHLKIGFFNGKNGQQRH
jgi:hypothetical protein